MAKFRLTEPYADEKEAKKAAKAKAKDLKRGQGGASVTIPGDTSVIAGAPLLFQGVRPGLDGVPYVIDTVTHEYSKSGFTTKIDAKLYDGKSASKSKSKDGAAGTTGAGTADKGKVAADAPDGTPATPPAFNVPRSSGQTDYN